MDKCSFPNACFNDAEKNYNYYYDELYDFTRIYNEEEDVWISNAAYTYAYGGHATIPDVGSFYIYKFYVFKKEDDSWKAVGLLNPFVFLKYCIESVEKKKTFLDFLDESQPAPDCHVSTTREENYLDIEYCHTEKTFQCTCVKTHDGRLLSDLSLPARICWRKVYGPNFGNEVTIEQIMNIVYTPTYATEEPADGYQEEGWECNPYDLYGELYDEDESCSCNHSFHCTCYMEDDTYYVDGKRKHSIRLISEMSRKERFDWHWTNHHIIYASLFNKKLKNKNIITGNTFAFKK